MISRIAAGLAVTALLGASWGCVSAEVRDGARAACEAQNTPPAEMASCIDRMAATIRAAREYQPPTTPPNQQ